MKTSHRTEFTEPSTAAARTASFEANLSEAIATAIAPLRPQLKAHCAESARLLGNVQKWDANAYEARLAVIRQAAMSGDESAAEAVASGSLPSRASYKEMENHARRQYETWDATNRGIFRQVKAAIAPVMPPVVAKAQAELDTQLDQLGAPRLRLIGAENRTQFIERELDTAASGAVGADLSWLWAVV